MEMLILIVGLFFGIVVPGLAIAAFIRAGNLQTRIEGLESQLGFFKRHLDSARQDITALKLAPQSPVVVPPVENIAPAKPSRPAKALAKKADDNAVKSVVSPPPLEMPIEETAIVTPFESAEVSPSTIIQAPPPLPSSLSQSVSATVKSTAPPAPSTAKPVRDLEEIIGTRWAVWVGGLALAIGGLFLVRYSIESGFFGPRVRLTMAAVFAGLLVILGEALRRGLFMPPKIVTQNVGALPLAHAPLALTAAGIISAFGTVYAAFAVYGFFSQTTAFLLMATIGVSAIVASLLHGQALAGIGLLASYATPILVGGESKDRWPLVVYLLVVTAAAAAVQNRLRSSWLAWGAIVGVGIWVALLTLTSNTVRMPELSLILGAMMIFASAFIWLNAPDKPETPFGDTLPLVSLMGLAAALGLAFLTTYTNAVLYGVFAIAAIIILLSTAIRDGRASLTVLAAALLPLGMILTWPSEAGDRSWLLRLIDGAIFAFVKPPVDGRVLAQLTVASAALVFAAPLVLLFDKVAAKVAHSKQGLHVLAFTGGLAPVILIFAWALRTGGVHRDLFVAAIFAATMVVMAIVSDQLYRRRARQTEGVGTQDMSASSIGAGAYASGGALALGLAIAFALPGLWMAVGFAVAALAVSLVSQYRPLPALRRVAAVMATTAVLRGITSPATFGSEAWPIFNWYIVAYAVPAFALAAAAYMLRKQSIDRNVRVLEGSALMALAAFAFFEVRHAFHQFRLGDADTIEYLMLPLRFHETWAFVLVALGFVALGLWHQRHNGGSPAQAAYKGGAAVMLAVTALGFLFIHSPFIPGIRVDGYVILNRLTVGYGIAVLATAAGAWLLSRDGIRVQAKALGLAAVALTGFWVVTQIRMAFHGATLLDRGSLGLGEAGVYTLALILSGLAVHFGAGTLSTLLKSELPTAKIIRAVNIAALVSAALLCVVLTNPFVDVPLSGPVFFDSSFVGYLLTGAGFGWFAWLGRKYPLEFDAKLTAVNRAAAIGLTYFYLMVQVRRSFAGIERFAFAMTTDGEQYVYSLVTLAFGVVLLAIGFKLVSRETRLASAMFVTLAVAKVFLWDMAGLTGLWRAFSFIGLGAVLIGIGLVYQRLLFGKGSKLDETAEVRS
jgi:uncharacterized membrane protein